MKCQRVVYFNASDLGEGEKRIQVVGSFRRGKLDVLGVQESYLRGCRLTECMRGNECDVWEGINRGVLWNGMVVGSKGRERKLCTFLISPKVWKGLEGHG